jgi:hypothetical protein
MKAVKKLLPLPGYTILALETIYPTFRRWVDGKKDWKPG